MVHIKTKPRAATGGSPLHHLQIAIEITERGNRAAADVLVDADRVARTVINEVDLRQEYEHGLAVAQLELRLDAAADDLL